ncbi:hypothetical protein [Bradyrhizobium sp. B120]|uniref:hypothetical protein n=1 Tax=Bradyrhizobium sp. B120 TaxID=3410088 RepID=UPI003B97FF5C
MDIKPLIAASFSPEEAGAYAAYSLSDADRTALAATGTDLLKHFPPIPAACLAMSSLHSVLLEKHVKQKAYVVVGSLFADSVRVFGEDGELDGKRFSQSDPSWDGHGWIVLGDQLADASLFRTARSGKGHPALAALVKREVSPQAGMMICKASDTEKSGLRYEARYVLTQNQVDGLARGAGRLMGAL